jgi:hypothetical protein
VKAAFSTTKLLSNTIHTANTRGMMKEIVSKKFSGVFAGFTITTSVETNEVVSI